jgi:hypothetical protein
VVIEKFPRPLDRVRFRVVGQLATKIQPVRLICIERVTRTGR